MNFEPVRLITLIAALVFILIGALARGFGNYRWHLFGYFCIGIGICLFIAWPLVADIISGRTT